MTNTSLIISRLNNYLYAKTHTGNFIYSSITRSYRSRIELAGFSFSLRVPSNLYFPQLQPSASSSFTGYDAALAGIDGAFAVDENGNELTLTNVDASKKFYIRIPAEKVTKTVQKVTVNVTGHFSASAVQYYVSKSNEGHQRLASVTSGNKNGGEEVEFVGTDDTGMNTAQTIYFIGLIVLLCGVGIVYANVKPVEAKQ